MHNKTQHFLRCNRLFSCVPVCIALLGYSGVVIAQDVSNNPVFPELPPLILGDASAPSEVKASGLDVSPVVISPAPTGATTRTNRRIASYGTWPKSIMFPEQEIQYMKTILDEYEATGEVPLSLQDLPEVVEVVEKERPKIVEFPSFHLKSILYHSPKHWGVWINDIKITNRDNHSSDAEIKVVNISKNIVRFEWKPSDTRFLQEFAHQLPDLRKIAKETVLPIANRISRSARQANLSRDNDALYFSLRLNESFSTETFYTFDGKPSILSYPSLDVPYSSGIEAVSTPASSDELEGDSFDAGGIDGESLDDSLSSDNNSDDETIDDDTNVVNADLES